MSVIKVETHMVKKTHQLRNRNPSKECTQVVKKKKKINCKNSVLR